MVHLRQPPKPAYVDPADRVASTKVTADDIKTWSVSEIDKKGKKKKGTLGIGNGSLFFASESDKVSTTFWDKHSDKLSTFSRLLFRNGKQEMLLLLPLRRPSMYR